MSINRKFEFINHHAPFRIMLTDMHENETDLALNSRYDLIYFYYYKMT